MARVWGSPAGYGSGCWWVGVRVRNLWPVSFKMSPRSCKTDKNWLRYGQKRVVSLSSPFLICFGCFWSHFEGKPIWSWGWGVMGLGCRLFPWHPREHPCYSLVKTQSSKGKNAACLPLQSSAVEKSHERVIVKAEPIHVTESIRSPSSIVISSEESNPVTPKGKEPICDNCRVSR